LVWEKEFPSAEIQSFCFWLNSLPKDGSARLKKVVLLPTKGTLAEPCAKYVKEILKAHVLPWGSQQNRVSDSCAVDIEPFSFDPSSPENFGEGAAGFVAKLWELINQCDKENVTRTVVNITGGYKVLAPLMALFGFQRPDVEVIYQHEDSKVTVTVPPVPMDWDFKLLDDYRTLVARGELGGLNVEPPSRFRAFFQPTSDGKWILNPLGMVLKQVYQEKRLERFGYGARLISRLKEDSVDELRQRISRWVHVWIGDIIPETVEHGRGHSQRLMEYAAEILEPILRESRDFLSEDELRCLISCLWLHDIGHTALRFRLPPQSLSSQDDNLLIKFKQFLAALGLKSFDDRSGGPGGKVKELEVFRFPSLVRMFHNFLSAQQICDASYGYLPEDERDAVALICIYDRKSMPLLEGQECWAAGEPFGIVAPPLALVVLGDGGIVYRRTSLTTKRVLLLCALLRVVDGLDIQSDRAVDDNYVQERVRRTQDEVSQLWKRLERLCNCLPSEFKQVNAELEDKLAEWKKSFDKLSEAFYNPTHDSQPCRTAQELASAIDEFVNDRWLGCLANNISCDDEMMLEALSVTDRLLFKMKQPAHFCKHRAVRFVFVTSEGGASKFRIRVVFDENAGDDVRHVVASEIWEEIAAVMGVLVQSDITFEGVYDVNGDALAPGPSSM
jgi:CRISPR/Cas system-associated protein Csm6